MGINNEETQRLAKKKNKAGVVEELLEIGHACASLPVLDKRPPEEMLYDQRGLPR